MNRYIAMLSCCAALVTSCALNAQDHEYPLALPKAERTNYTFEFGPRVSRIKSKDASLGGRRGSTDTFYGIGAAFGWRFDWHYKVALSVALDAFSHDYAGISQDVVLSNVSMHHLFYIPLTPSGRCELHIGAVAGITYQNIKINDSSDSDSIAIFGASAGVTCHLSRVCYLDFSYSLESTFTDSHFNLYGQEINLRMTGLNRISVAIGFKF